MTASHRALVIASILFCTLPYLVLAAEPLPITGKKVPAFEPVDKATTEFMETIGCTSATVAISKNGKLLYARGFGWSDEAKQKPTAPEALMRIASVTKPITAATVKAAISAKLIAPDTKAFEYLAIKIPIGKSLEPQLSQITIENLLDHKGGWNPQASFDPMFRLKVIGEELSLNGPAKPVNIVEYMLDKPLQNKPGQKYAYSNFGYCVLGRVLEKATKKPYFDIVQEIICKPLGIKDIKPASSDLKKRDPREVWYPAEAEEIQMEVLDSVGGLIASAPALCQFMDAYWIGGDQRQAGSTGEWTAFGSLPGTTAMAHQRKDGHNVAVLMNGRRKTFVRDNDLLKKNLDQALQAPAKK